MQKSLDMLFTAPGPLLAGRLIFDLDPSPGLSKTVKNFAALCTGEKGMCKNARNKKLHYLDCPMHRIIKGFVAQGGDITRGDGSGGEVRLSTGTFGRLNLFVCASHSRSTEGSSTTTRPDSKPSSKRDPWRWQTRARTQTRPSSLSL